MPAPPPLVDDSAGRLLTAVGYLFLVALGIALGVIGSFLVPAAPALFGRELSMSVPFVLVTNPAAAVLARRLVPQRLGAGVPLLAWLAVVLILGSSRPEGDVVVPGDLHGTTFLFAGAIGGALALNPRRRRVGGRSSAGRATPRA